MEEPRKSARRPSKWLIGPWLWLFAAAFLGCGDVGDAPQVIEPSRGGSTVGANERLGEICASPQGWLDFYPSAELREARLTHVLFEAETTPGVPMVGIWDPQELRFRARSSNRRSLVGEAGRVSLRLHDELRTYSFEALSACRMAEAAES